MDNNIVSRRMCRPAISGPLWYLDTKESVPWSIDRWKDELDEQRELGFELIWLCNISSMLDAPGDSLGRLLDLCAERKVQAILDCGWTHNWYDLLDLNAELDMCSKHVSRVAERYGSHPAFFAWYVPHEVYMCWDKMAAYINTLYPALVERCKGAADLPMTLSPFFILDKDKIFGDYRYPEPDEYSEYWARLIKRSGFDIIMLQDSGEHFSYVTNEQRRPFFEAMEAACRESGAKLWGNVETAEYLCPSIEEYMRLYGRVHHSKAQGIPWRAVPIDRLKDKLELAAEYSERIVCWGYREFNRPILGPDARRWYGDYENYYRQLHRGETERC